MATITGGTGIDSLLGTSGNDSITGLQGNDTILGGDGNDTIVAGPETEVLTALDLNWFLQGGNNTNLQGGFTQNTGGINVNVAYSETSGGSNFVRSSATTYVQSGEAFSPTSSALFTGVNLGTQATISVGFSAVAGSGFASQVQNVEFRLNDIDRNLAGTRIEQVTVLAYDADNNLMPVTITPAGNDTVSGQTVTAGAGSDAASSASGSALVTIPGPVARFEIIIANAGTSTSTSDIYVSDIRFNAVALDNDSVLGGAGNDVISGGDGADSILGGIGSDSIDAGGGDDFVEAGPETHLPGQDLVLDWTSGGEVNGTVITGGFTQNTGGMNVTVGYVDLGAGTNFAVDTRAEYTGGGPFDPNSGAVLNGTGLGLTSQVNFNFAAVAGSGFDDEVQHAQFRINDVDSGAWQDQIVIRAFDADGNPVAVTLTAAGNDTVSGNTVTAGPGGDNAVDAGGSVLVKITGPVARIEVVYSNLLTGTQLITLTDVHFQTIALDDDNVLGGEGNDTLFGGYGDDSLVGGPGDDSLVGGLGSDTLDGGEGNDLLAGGEGKDLLLGGAGNDTISGGTGADSVSGGSGDDVILGGAGNDTIFVGDGLIVADGGEDSDLFVIANTAGGTAPPGNNSSIIGGEGDSPDGGPDFDVLNLTAWGRDLTNVVFTGPEAGYVEFLDGTGNPLLDGSGNPIRLFFTEIERVIPCFTAGTMITTPSGTVPIETLEVGDLVLTRDNGAQPIRWIGRRTLTAANLVLRPQYRPVRFHAGSLGAGLPRRDLTVSPQHRMLILSTAAELLCGENEVLVPARHLAGRPGIETLPAAAVTYIHLLFDAHEIVLSEGAWSESFQPGAQLLGDMDEAQREEVLGLFPELAEGAAAEAYPAARITLKAREAALVL